jgi:hypothetical protein
MMITKRIRIPVIVTEDGGWAAQGCRGRKTEEDAAELLRLYAGSTPRLIYVEATIIVPKPTVMEGKQTEA